MLEIRLAKTPKEKEQVFKLRYQIYVEELGYTQHYVDHKHKILEEPLDKSANIFAAYQNGQIIGTVRSNYAKNSNLEYYPQLYKMRDFIGDAHPRYTSISTKLMVKKELRGSTLALRLMRANYQQLLVDGVKFDFIDCEPHMIPFFQKLGYQPIEMINHPEYGSGLAMMLNVFNFKHLEQVKSPF
ncbi:MAG TPA: GNAT family N-acetyltransferase [Candidatus Sericytochromatia bacterium]|jgi:predicted GNAT family N-acyltransferase